MSKPSKPNKSGHMSGSGQMNGILDLLSERGTNNALENEGFTEEKEKDDALDKIEEYQKLTEYIGNLTKNFKLLNEGIEELDKTINDIDYSISEVDKDIISEDAIITSSTSTPDEIRKAENRKKELEDRRKNLERERIKNETKRDNIREERDKTEKKLKESNKQKKKKEDLFETLYPESNGIASARNAVFGQRNNKLGGAANFISKVNKWDANPTVEIITRVGKFVFDTFAKVLTLMTEYAKKENENFIRGLNATTDVAVNTQKIALASWVDAVNGAYEAQSAMIENLKTLTDATVENELANKRFTASVVNASMAFAESIPLIGKFVGMFTATTKAAFERDIAFLEMEGKVFQAQMNNAQKVVNSVKGFTTKTDEYLKKQDNAIKNYGRSVMMSVNQIDLFEERLLGVGTTFAEIGRTIEDALKIQGAVTEKTGREVNYSNEDFTKSLATANIVGDDNLIQFQSEMHIFNKSVGDSADIMFETTRDIAKMGLSTKKVTSSILNNLKLANKYSFKNGTKGLIELSKWAENVRFNLTNLGSMLEKVQTGGLEGTITQAARLQVLGGRFAMGADPLAMLYEAHEDPDAYAKRMHTMIKGMGSVNKETGETVFNMSEQRMLRAYADAAGMSYEDVLTMAREDNKKEVVSRQMKNTGLSKEQISAVANKAQRDSETGRWYVNTISGGRIDVSDVNSSTDLEQILSNDKTEQSLQYAKETLSVEQEIKANTDYISALLGGESFLNFRETASKSIAESRKHYEENLAEYVKATEGFRNRSVEDQEKMLSKMTDISTKYDESLKTMDRIERLMEERIGIMVDVYNLAKVEKEKEQAEKINKEAEKAYKAEVKRLEGKVESSSDKHRAESDSLKKQELKKVWDDFEKELKSVKNDKEGWINNYKTNRRDILEKVNDGIVSAKNNPMSVVATDVVPIQDGKVKLAKTDPKDSAIFAKNGGPFDTLFNDIFGKINEVYKDVSGRHEIETSSIPSTSETTNNQYTSNVLSKILEFSTTNGFTYGFNDILGKTQKPTNRRLNHSNVNNVFNSDSSTVMNDVYGDTINTVLNRLFNSDKTFNDYGDTFGGRNIRRDETITNALSNIYNDTFERKSENNTFNDNTASFLKSNGKDVTELILNKVEGNEERSYAEKPLTMLYDSSKEPQSVLKHTGDIFSNVSDKTTAIGESALTTNQNTNTTVTNNGQYNVSISGNIKLDAGNKTFDISKELETNPFLVRQITQLISENISKSMNGGKAENAGIMNLNVFRK